MFEFPVDWGAFFESEVVQQPADLGVRPLELLLWQALLKYEFPTVKTLRLNARFVRQTVVIHPSPKAQMGLTESKIVILDFGTSGDWQTMLANVEAGLSGGTFPSTVTILQLPMIERLDAAGELSTFIARWQSARQSGWNAVWVLPKETSTRDDVF